MGRVGFSWNNAREHFDDAARDVRHQRQPDADRRPSRSKNGGQFAPQSGGSGSGTIYINAKWQFNANAMYQAAWGIELSANVFGRQGYPFPIVRTGTRRRSAPTRRSPSCSARRSTRSASRTCGTRTSAWRSSSDRGGRSNIRLILDVFNVMNANTALVRVNDVTSTRFNALAQNLSPRIARVGVVVGF